MDNQITISTEEYRQLIETQTRVSIVSNLETRERYLSTDTILHVLGLVTKEELDEFSNLHVLGLVTKEELDEFSKTMQNAAAANLRRQICDLQHRLADLTPAPETPCAPSESAAEVTA